jgi:8-oxo-dGTP pyrophosphatase MutT (NUDIX family)
MTAIGVWFYSVATDRYLYLLRSSSFKNTWALPGGKINPSETLLAALQRECTEELGVWPDTIKLVPIEQFTSNSSKFVYHTFFALIANEFTPTLNSEHHGYAWLKSGTFPYPMHPGLWSTVNFESVQTKIEVVKQTQISQ